MASSSSAESRRQRLESVDLALREKSNYLDAKLEGFRSSVKKEEMLYVTPKGRRRSDSGLLVKSGYGKKASRSLEAEADGLRRRCAEIVARQTFLVERAESIAAVEGRLGSRLMALERSERPELSPVEDLDADLRGFSEATLDAAWKLLAKYDREKRPQSPSQNTPPTRVERAWLATLKTEVEARAVVVTKDVPLKEKIVASSAWVFSDAIGLGPKMTLEDEESSCAVLALRVRSVKPGLDRAIEIIGDAGGDVIRLTANVAVGIFIAEKKEEDWPCTAATLAGLTAMEDEESFEVAAVSRGSRLAIFLKETGKILIRSAAITEAFNLLNQAQKKRCLVVSRQVAHRLARRGYPKSAFVLDTQSEGVSLRANVSPPPALLLSTLRRRKRHQNQVPAANFRKITPAAMLARNGGDDWFSFSDDDAISAATFVVLRIENHKKNDVTDMAYLASRACHAFGGRCYDADLAVVSSEKEILTMVFVFWDDTEAKAYDLAVAAAFAAERSLHAAKEVTSLGVAKGSARLLTVGVPGVDRVIASPALDEARRLASLDLRTGDCPRVLCSDANHHRATVVLEDLGFPCLRDAFHTTSSSHHGTAATLLRPKRPLFLKARVRMDFLEKKMPDDKFYVATSVPDSLQEAAVANILGRRRREVPRDVATTALLAYRLAFASRPCTPPFEAFFPREDNTTTSSSLSLALWNEAPLCESAFAQMAEAALPGCDDATKDALWIRSRGVPARIAALASSWRRASSVAAASSSSSSSSRGEHVPEAVREALLDLVDQLPLAHAALLRFCAVGGGGLVETLRSAIVAVPALQDAFFDAAQKRDKLREQSLATKKKHPIFFSVSPTIKDENLYRGDLDTLFSAADDNENNVLVHPTPPEESFEESFHRVLADLGASGLVDVVNGGYVIPDPLLVDSLYESTPSPRRRALHAAHAALLRRDLEEDKNSSEKKDDDLVVLSLAHHASLSCDADVSFAAAAEIAARGHSRFLLSAAAKAPRSAAQIPPSKDPAATNNRRLAAHASDPSLRGALAAIQVANVAATLLNAAGRLLLLRSRKQQQQHRRKATTTATTKENNNNDDNTSSGGGVPRRRYLSKTSLYSEDQK